VQMALGGSNPIAPSLSDGSKYRSKRYMRFDKQIWLCDTPNDVVGAAAALRAYLGGGIAASASSIGIDIEWEYIPSSQPASGDSDRTQR
jgi:hypothetical protein